MDDCLDGYKQRGRQSNPALFFRLRFTLGGAILSLRQTGRKVNRNLFDSNRIIAGRELLLIRLREPSEPYGLVKNKKFDLFPLVFSICNWTVSPTPIRL